MRIGEDLCAVVANGVGGGSLINAGVMAFPTQSVFEAQAWPKSLRGSAAFTTLQALSQDIQKRLGASQTVKSVTPPPPKKFSAMEKLAHRDGLVPVAISVALTNNPQDRFQTAAGINIDACVRCGKTPSRVAYFAQAY